MKKKGKKFKVCKTPLIITSVTVVCVAVIIIAITVFLPRAISSSGYTAVHLEGGEVYFGKLSRFPRLTLSDVHTIQVIPDPKGINDSTVLIVPFNSAIWGPERLYLNRDKILYISEVSEDSQVMRGIRQIEAN